ncbi:MAG: hypothetical protein M3R41_00335 [Pseudomonadota bacterium]|nr:hypothetical protein [Pseudomonadota bacterium]
MITDRFLMGRQRGALSADGKQGIENAMAEFRSARRSRISCACMSSLICAPI